MDEAMYHVEYKAKKCCKKWFWKDFFKLMSNSVNFWTYDQQCELMNNSVPLNHKDTKLVTRRWKYVKYVMNTNVKDEYPFQKSDLLQRWENWD